MRDKPKQVEQMVVDEKLGFGYRESIRSELLCKGKITTYVIPDGMKNRASGGRPAICWLEKIRHAV
jgi:hypothetical protein